MAKKVQDAFRRYAKRIGERRSGNVSIPQRCPWLIAIEQQMLTCGVAQVVWVHSDHFACSKGET